LGDGALEGSRKSVLEQLLDVRAGLPQGALDFHGLALFPSYVGFQKRGKKCDPFPPHSPHRAFEGRVKAAALGPE